jgi:hypothetical protein
MAARGAWLFRQHDGVAFLATVRRDGSPQPHPVMPHIVDGALYLFIVTMSSKHGDLLRDGRFALHAIPAGDRNEEFLVSGRARAVETSGLRAAVESATGGARHDWEALFSLDIEKCLHTSWERWAQSDPWPTFRRWKDNTPRPNG